MDSEGKYHHLFEDISLESEEQERSNFNEDQYVEALYEINPDLEDAVTWGTENLSPDLLNVYNKKIDSDSLSDLNEAVEFILDQYRNRTQDAPPQVKEEESDDSEVDELSEEETQILNDAAQESGNETYALVAAATSSFHAGEVSAQEAIDFCLNNCDLKELSQVYQYLMNQ